MTDGRNNPRNTHRGLSSKELSGELPWGLYSAAEVEATDAPVWVQGGAIGKPVSLRSNACRVHLRTQTSLAESRRGCVDGTLGPDGQAGADPAGADRDFRRCLGVNFERRAGHHRVQLTRCAKFLRTGVCQLPRTWSRNGLERCALCRERADASCWLARRAGREYSSLRAVEKALETGLFYCRLTSRASRRCFRGETERNLTARPSWERRCPQRRWRCCSYGL